MRAYVFIEGGSIPLNEEASAIRAAIKVRNWSRTPGYEFTTWSAIELGLPDDFPYERQGPPMQRSIIGPFTDFNPNTVWMPVSIEQIDAITRGDLLIFVWGYCRYRDAFGRYWRMRFHCTNEGQVINLGNEHGRVIRGWSIRPDLRIGYIETEETAGQP